MYIYWQSQTVGRTDREMKTVHLSLQSYDSRNINKSILNVSERMKEEESVIESLHRWPNPNEEIRTVMHRRLMT